MNTLYPSGPTSVPDDFTRATPAYRLHAWLAMSGLLLFLLIYFALAGWFAWQAWHLIDAGGQNQSEAGTDFLMALPAAFLCLFMIKGLFFIQRSKLPDDVEISAAEQPELFSFLFRLADELQAPRPHRVFVSPRVNAAVFYDLSMLNLLLPSRKNLEIGLGLVNALNIGEFKAVLAHEFGHFAQRSMLVGRWVYLAQQIAGQLIARRDAMDAFLQKLSRIDIRLAWIGWLLSLIIWSIRSLLETVFKLVVLAQRALSREMEFQADRVSVSACGSDAIVAALHRLSAADDAWARALSTAADEWRLGRKVTDIFALQTHVIMRMAEILDESNYGQSPLLPADSPETYRVFTLHIVNPPQMWQTHPSNNDREENAKALYISAEGDTRSAWMLFKDADLLRQQVTQELARKFDAKPSEVEEAKNSINKQFDWLFLRRHYRGAYLGRSVVNYAERLSDLYNPDPHYPDLAAALNGLYPESLADDLEFVRQLESEKLQLEALRDKSVRNAGGLIRFRGRELQMHQLSPCIEEVSRELSAIRERVIAHDRNCRSVHMAIANELGLGWPEYLRSLLRALHYCEHVCNDLQDLRGFLSHVVAIVTADKKVSSDERTWVVRTAGDLYTALSQIFSQCEKIILSEPLLSALQINSLSEAMGEFKLTRPTEGNIGDWLNIIDSWCSGAYHQLMSVRSNVLQQLVASEANLAAHWREQSAIESAPGVLIFPDQYPVLLPGKARKRSAKLNPWEKFLTASGVLPELLRLTVATAIVLAVVLSGASMGNATISISNGLARGVDVHINGVQVSLQPYTKAELSLPLSEKLQVKTQSDAQVIEEFDVKPEGNFPHYIYNIASATALLQWTATYGHGHIVPSRSLGLARWQLTQADDVFREPPHSVNARGPQSRTVISDSSNDTARAQLATLTSERERLDLLATHLRWDEERGKHTVEWLYEAKRQASFKELLALRLQLFPLDAVALNLEQDMAQGESLHEVCQRQKLLAEQHPEKKGLGYLITRCITDAKERHTASLDGYHNDPSSPWYALSAAYVLAGKGEWQQSLAAFQDAQAKSATMKFLSAVDTDRVLRLLHRGSSHDEKTLRAQNEALDNILWSDAKATPSLPPLSDGDSKIVAAYRQLGSGELAAARLSVQSMPNDYERIVRLSASSDGADPSQIKTAFDLPMEKGMDRYTLLPALALAARNHKATNDYYALLPRWFDSNEIIAVKEFVRGAYEQHDWLKANALLDQQGIIMRGLLASMGCVLLQEQAPKNWRIYASFLLFNPERPYFKYSEK